MSPQELFDYKKSWLPGYNVYVDVDSDVFAKNWCRRNLERHQWSFSKHALPDDGHEVTFEHREHCASFALAYNKHNPRYNIL